MPEPTSSAFRLILFQGSFPYEWASSQPRISFSNMLALVPEGEQPRSRIVGPKLSYMDERIAAIDLVISKLVRGSSLLLPRPRPSLSPLQRLTLAVNSRENNFKR